MSKGLNVVEMLRNGKYAHIAFFAANDMLSLMHVKFLPMIGITASVCASVTQVTSF